MIFNSLNFYKIFTANGQILSPIIKSDINICNSKTKTIFLYFSGILTYITKKNTVPNKVKDDDINDIMI